MKATRLRIACATGLVALLPTVSSGDSSTSDAPITTSAIAPLVAYQGYLEDGSGYPLGFPDATTVNLDVALWDSLVGGAEAWSEIHTSVSVSSGVFQVVLGSVSSFPAGLFDGGPLFLGVRVNGGAEMPRSQLLATPFALRAARADRADSADVAIADDGDWSTAGADVYLDSGRVAIGHMIPSSTLDVQGLVTADSLRIPTGAADGHVLKSDAAGNAYWGAPGGGAAGAAFASRDNGYWISYGTPPSTLLSGTIDPPGAGTVVAIASVEALTTNADDPAEGRLGVSLSLVDAVENPSNKRLVSSDPGSNGQATHTAIVQDVLTVTDGAPVTVYIVVANNSQPTLSVRAGPASLVLMYVPNQY